MQIKLFSIPVNDNGNTLEEMNRFLRGNKILEIENHLINNDHGATWCFCIRYLLSNTKSFEYSKTQKVDYKHILDEATFLKFSKLREIRKTVASNEGIPAFAVFTDEELAGLAKLDSINRKAMLSIKGIGDKKVERFAAYFITTENDDETTGTPDC